MASGGRAKRFRGNHTHGRGKKAGRGAGLRGGRGRAGANKHRYLMLQLLGGKHEHTAAKPWGRIGFKYRSRDQSKAADVATVNVGDLAVRFPGRSDIDLTAAGIGKLLGSGTAVGALTVKVESATAGAVQKVQAAGGKVVLPEGAAPTSKHAKAEAKAAAAKANASSGKGAPAKGGAPAKPAGDKAKADKPAGDKPKADKPAGDKPKADKPSGDKPKADKPKADKPKA